MVSELFANYLPNRPPLDSCPVSKGAPESDLDPKEAQGPRWGVGGGQKVRQGVWGEGGVGHERGVSYTNVPLTFGESALLDPRRPSFADCIIDPFATYLRDLGGPGKA